MIALTLATLALALALAAPDRFDRYFDRVKPLLAARCVACHGPDQQAGKLRLDSAEGLAAGGSSGPAVDREDLGSSLILAAVRRDGTTAAMPPKERLDPAQVADLTAWALDGAPMPAPARVLFEDEPSLIAALAEGQGSASLVDDRLSGESAPRVAGQRQSSAVPGWNVPVRERPGPGEVRHLRFAWRKRGGGGLMVELARDGRWRARGEVDASWVAGPNTTGWPAIEVDQTAPAGWAVVTRDLWAEGGPRGEWSITGLGVTAIDGGEVDLDAVILGPTVEALDAYKPGRGIPSTGTTNPLIGDPWTDASNPIRAIFGGRRLDLWSLRKPVRVEPPEARGVVNPIDRFIRARLDAAGIAPSPEADRRTLIRRLSFDVTGLPPSPEAVDAFLADADPRAYDRLVDRLLASPRYGERWGRYWLDVVRYADTNGFERDEFRPNMWRYRDYVIRALNADKPYDRFVAEQLAGDELAAGPVRTRDDADRIAATGYLRLGTFDSTTALFTEDKKGRDELMGDLANTTGAAFLGLTMSCCQCHDHKYDPLSQADHYRLRAFFAAVEPRDEAVISPPAEVQAIARHNAASDLRGRAARLARRAILGTARRRPGPARRPRRPARRADQGQIEAGRGGAEGRGGRGVGGAARGRPRADRGAVEHGRGAGEGPPAAGHRGGR